MEKKEFSEKSWDIKLLTNNYSTFDIEKGCTDIKVAIIDSGIDMNHPGLEKAVKKRVSFIDSFPETDFTGHGTMIAGQIAGNGLIPGIAPGISINSYKVFDKENKTKLRFLIDALEMALKDEVNIINMSLGFYLSDEDNGKDTIKKLEEILVELNKREILCISSAGYENDDRIHYPSSLKTVLSCQSLSKSYQKINKNIKADYCIPSGDYRLSNFFNGGEVEFVPVYVPLDTPNKVLKNLIGYSFMNGESLASAKLSATLAVIQSWHYKKHERTLLNREIIDLLKNNSEVVEESYMPILSKILENIK